MAGTTPLSLTQQFDPLGNPLSGGLLYFFVAGTVSTPQNVFKDIALTQPWPNPITLDVAGRVVQHFVADGLIKIRLTDNAGVVQLSADNIQVIGASSGGGGGGGAVDATTVFQTGDIKKRYGVGIHTGWVRANARTIGNSLSSATELADPSAQALFIYLWIADPNLVVIGGRGSTGLADWNAGKQMTLPDGRGTAFAGMDDMGGVAANRLTASYFGANATVLGARGGSEQHTLTELETPLKTHAHTGSTSAYTPTSGGLQIKAPNTGSPGNQATFSGPGTVYRTQDFSLVDPTNIAFTTASANAAAGSGHVIVQPTMVVTFYIKL
jgi:microcystin-dependent protein